MKIPPTARVAESYQKFWTTARLVAWRLHRLLKNAPKQRARRYGMSVPQDYRQAIVVTTDGEPVYKQPVQPFKCSQPP
jgi:hypothetical protein